MAITGPDGSGKSTTARMVALRLGEDFRVVQPGPSRPVYAVLNRRIEYPFQRLIHLIHRLHALADRTRLRFVVGAVNTLNVLVCARVIEPSMVQRFAPDLVLSGRDFRVDPCVYSSVYLPAFAELSLRTRLEWLGRLTGVAFNDVVFFLTVPPGEAIRRIDARIVAERSDPRSIAETRSWRWRHIHEDPQTLAFLQREFFRAFDVLQGQWPVHVYEIDTSDLPQAEVVEFIVTTVRAYMATPRTTATSRRWVRHSSSGTIERHDANPASTRSHGTRGQECRDRSGKEPGADDDPPRAS